MTTLLKRFETVTVDTEKVTIDLEWDKHDAYCVHVTFGDPQLNLPRHRDNDNKSFKTAHSKYKRQVSRYNCGALSFETITSYCYDLIRQTKSTYNG